MGILLAFAPFIVFAVVDRLVGSSAGLLAGAAVALLLLIHDWLIKKKSPKILESVRRSCFVVCRFTSWPQNQPGQ
jgi:hypothetical protein